MDPTTSYVQVDGNYVPTPHRQLLPQQFHRKASPPSPGEPANIPETNTWPRKAASGSASEVGCSDGAAVAFPAGSSPAPGGERPHISSGRNVQGRSSTSRWSSSSDRSNEESCVGGSGGGAATSPLRPHVSTTAPPPSSSDHGLLLPVALSGSVQPLTRLQQLQEQQELCIRRLSSQLQQQQNPAAYPSRSTLFPGMPPPSFFRYMLQSPDFYQPPVYSAVHKKVIPPSTVVASRAASAAGQPWWQPLTLQSSPPPLPPPGAVYRAALSSAMLRRPRPTRSAAAEPRTEGNAAGEDSAAAAAVNCLLQKRLPASHDPARSVTVSTSSCASSCEEENSVNMSPREKEEYVGGDKKSIEMQQHQKNDFYSFQNDQEIITNHKHWCHSTPSCAVCCCTDQLPEQQQQQNSSFPDGGAYTDGHFHGMQETDDCHPASSRVVRRSQLHPLEHQYLQPLERQQHSCWKQQHSDYCSTEQVSPYSCWWRGRWLPALLGFGSCPRSFRSMCGAAALALLLVLCLLQRAADVSTGAYEKPEPQQQSPMIGGEEPASVLATAPGTASAAATGIQEHATRTLLFPKEVAEGWALPTENAAGLIDSTTAELLFTEAAGVQRKNALLLAAPPIVDTSVRFPYQHHPGGHRDTFPTTESVETRGIFNVFADAGLCSDPSYKPNTLRLAHEQPFFSLFSRSNGITTFEASDVTAAGDALYVVFDSLYAIGRTDFSLTPFGHGNRLLYPLPPGLGRLEAILSLNSLVNVFVHIDLHQEEEEEDNIRGVFESIDKYLFLPLHKPFELLLSREKAPEDSKSDWEAATVDALTGNLYIIREASLHGENASSRLARIANATDLLAATAGSATGAADSTTGAATHSPAGAAKYSTGETTEPTAAAANPIAAAPNLTAAATNLTASANPTAAGASMGAAAPGREAAGSMVQPSPGEAPCVRGRTEGSAAAAAAMSTTKATSQGMSPTAAPGLSLVTAERSGGAAEEAKSVAAAAVSNRGTEATGGIHDAGSFTVTAADATRDIPGLRSAEPEADAAGQRGPPAAIKEDSIKTSKHSSLETPSTNTSTYGGAEHFTGAAPCATTEGEATASSDAPTAVNCPSFGERAGGEGAHLSDALGAEKAEAKRASVVAVEGQGSTDTLEPTPGGGCEPSAARKMMLAAVTAKDRGDEETLPSLGDATSMGKAAPRATAKDKRSSNKTATGREDRDSKESWWSRAWHRIFPPETGDEQSPAASSARDKRHRPAAAAGSPAPAAAPVHLAGANRKHRKTDHKAAADKAGSKVRATDHTSHNRHAPAIKHRRTMPAEQSPVSRMSKHRRYRGNGNSSSISGAGGDSVAVPSLGGEEEASETPADIAAVHEEGSQIDRDHNLSEASRMGKDAKTSQEVSIVHYHAIVERVRIQPGGLYVVMESCRTEKLFSHGNKGFEGVAGFRDLEGTYYLLGLCEGNFCKGGVQGEQRGNGRLILMRREEEMDDLGNTTCLWKTVKIIKLPREVFFQDYSSLALHGTRIAITSQADSLLWIGELQNVGEDEAAAAAGTGRGAGAEVVTGGFKETTTDAANPILDASRVNGFFLQEETVEGAPSTGDAVKKSAVEEHTIDVSSDETEVKHCESETALSQEEERRLDTAQQGGMEETAEEANLHHRRGPLLRVDDVNNIEVKSGGRILYFPRDSNCDVVYCNVEGITFITDTLLAAASDKAKTYQDSRCIAKEQSLHIFAIPPERKEGTKLRKEK